MIDPIELTQQLVRIDSRNPPGNERGCADLLQPLLEELGLSVSRHSFGEGRFSLVARRAGSGKAAMFTGHLDTVPLGTLAWTVDPFGGEIVDGRLYGRGACDMKAGVAAMIAAIAAEPDRTVTLVLTGGEETGAEGAKALAEADLLGEAAFLVVGEPTANRFLHGHKGALWLDACCTGITAHGSTPHLGDNALLKAAHAVVRLEDYQFNAAPHAVMGSPTLNIGTMQAGQNINSVPDRAEFTLDIRTVPGLSHDRVREQIGATAGEAVRFDTIVDLPAVWSPPEGAEMTALAATYTKATGRPVDATSAAYFTDASVLTPALGGIPTVICGPGDPALAHKTDEYCDIGAIGDAVSIYRHFLADRA